MIIAALSALFGLRQVVLSPLGVRTRQNAPEMSWVRVVFALLVVCAAVFVAQKISPGWGVIVSTGAITAVVIAVMAMFGVVGPFVVSRIAHRTASRTSNPARLVAARGIHDDPRSAWRSVSALALASFIVIPTGSLLGYLNAISHSASREIMTDDQLLLFTDARTMLLVLTAVSFIVVACQAAITQTANIIERRELYLALDRIGMPRTELNQAHRLRVTMPAITAVIGAAVVAVALSFHLVVAAAATAPLFTIAIVIVLVLGLLLIRTAVAATTPVLQRVLEAPARDE